MSGPVRIQLSRRKGWRIPENTVVVSRPSKWGNPHDWRAWLPEWRDCKVGPQSEGEKWCRDRATQAFEEDIADGTFRHDVGELRGKNLACWCPPGDPCHAEVLLKLANK